MVDYRLVSFIRKSLKEGSSLRDIKSNLKNSGWSDKNVNEAVEFVIPSGMPKPKTYCWNCGTENDTTAKACKNCGVNLEEVPKEKRKKEIKEYFKKVGFSKKKFFIFLVILVIIGFTIALTSIIITWHTGFTKKMQTQTEVKKTTCYNALPAVKSICKLENGYKIQIFNNGMDDIPKITIKLSQDGNEQIIKYDKGIVKFGMEEFIVTPTTVTQVKSVDVNAVGCGVSDSFKEGDHHWSVNEC